MELLVEKRDGRLVPYDSDKIISAVNRACHEVDANMDIGSSIENVVHSRIKLEYIKSNESPVSVECIQDIVEEELMNSRPKVARVYIRYRYDREKVRSIKPKSLVNSYVDNLDWRVKENASVSYSLGGMILNNSGAVTANYWLNEVYTPDIADAHKSAQFHIHDLSMLSTYCVGHNLLDLIKRGLSGVHGKITSAPAKHLSTLCNQMVNFLGCLQNESAGAQAFSSVDTYLAPYVKIDNLDYDEVYQCMQSLIYGLNVPSRWGTQAPFSNFTLDLVVPRDLMNENCWVGNKQMDFKYKDCQKEMDLINEVLIDIFEAGDANGRGFAYPIPTYSITKDFDWDSKVAKKLFKLTGKYGVPYFQNFINSDLNPSDVRSMCCRLRLDKRELFKKGGGLFGAAEQTGSVGVVTINLPQLAYLSNGDLDEFYTRLDSLLELAKKSLVIKRSLIKKLMSQGFYPYSKAYIKTLDTHFNTIGINGCHEAILNFTKGKYGIEDDYGVQFAKDLLSHINDKLADFQEETGDLFNLEASPAEGVSNRFAIHDKHNYPDIITSGTDEKPYYTNSTWLPANFGEDLFEVLDHQDDLQTLYTGGTVLHTYLGESIDDSDTVAKLIKTVFTKYKLPYLTISPTYSVCDIHGYIKGEVKYCPHCRDIELDKINKRINEINKLIDKE